MKMNTTFDHCRGQYCIKYRIANQEIETYLDGDSTKKEIDEWQKYHLSIARDLAIRYILYYDNRYRVQRTF